MTRPFWLPCQYSARSSARPPSADELAALLDYVSRQRKRLKSGQLDAAAICKTKNASAELAVWVMVARVVMNLDETITRN